MYEYLTKRFISQTFIDNAIREMDKTITQLAADGWRVHTCQYVECQGMFVVLFEKKKEEKGA